MWPLPCAGTAFMAKAAPFPCGLCLVPAPPSWLRQRFSLVVLQVVLQLQARRFPAVKSCHPHCLSLTSHCLSFDLPMPFALPFVDTPLHFLDLSMPSLQVAGRSCACEPPRRCHPRRRLAVALAAEGRAAGAPRAQGCGAGVVVAARAAADGAVAVAHRLDWPRQDQQRRPGDAVRHKPFHCTFHCPFRCPFHSLSLVFD